MTSRHAPPGRTSISWIVVRNPFGPYQCGRCFGSVHTLNTSSRGASSRRVVTISRSGVVATARSDICATGDMVLSLRFRRCGRVLLAAAFLGLRLLGLFRLQFLQVDLQPVE